MVHQRLRLLPCLRAEIEIAANPARALHRARAFLLLQSRESKAFVLRLHLASYEDTTVEMQIVETEDPNEDFEAKQTLWEAILRIAEQMHAKWRLEAFLSTDRSEPIARGVPMPPDDLWKLAEILSVFVLLRDAETVQTTRVHNLRARINAPICFIKGGEPFYLWTQERMTESLSGLTGIPDITITTTVEPPSRGNATDIIEVKSGRINGRLIRQEFAKGFDLRIRSYCIWSYVEPSAALIEGARLLGIKFAPLGFGSSERHLVLDPDALIARFADQLLNARDSATFEEVLERTGNETGSKRQHRLQR